MSAVAGSYRTPQAYSRPEFVQAIDVQVVRTLDRFEYWRTSNWRRPRDAVLGPAPDGGLVAADQVGGVLVAAAE